jgi:LPXTG-site transpeptidase (sortase) family protein
MPNDQYNNITNKNEKTQGENNQIAPGSFSVTNKFTTSDNKKNDIAIDPFDEAEKKAKNQINPAFINPAPISPAPLENKVNSQPAFNVPKEQNEQNQVNIEPNKPNTGLEEPIIKATLPQENVVDIFEKNVPTEIKPIGVTKPKESIPIVNPIPAKTLDIQKTSETIPETNLPKIETPLHPESVDIFEHPETSKAKISNGLLEQKKSPLWQKIVVIPAVFIAITLFVYFFLNFPAFYEKIKFSISPPKIENTVTPKNETTIAPSVSTREELYYSFSEEAFNVPVNYVIIPSPPPNNNNDNNNSDHGTNDENNELSNDTLSIPRLGKKVPIIWNSPYEDDAMLANLQKGVVHYIGTALPGEGKGPIFISGHSSYYWWDKGKYKTVFANLNKMENGDKIQIKYNDRIYTYEVFDKVVVMPENVEELQSMNEPVLKLMTCVPVGTNQKRLIVKAREI